MDEAGNSGIAKAKYIIDASGHKSHVYRHVGERIYSNFFQNLALFGYYENAERFPPPRDGNIHYLRTKQTKLGHLLSNLEAKPAKH